MPVVRLIPLSVPCLKRSTRSRNPTCCGCPEATVVSKDVTGKIGYTQVASLPLIDVLGIVQQPDGEPFVRPFELEHTRYDVLPG